MSVAEENANALACAEGTRNGGRGGCRGQQIKAEREGRRRGEEEPGMGGRGGRVTWQRRLPGWLLIERHGE